MEVCKFEAVLVVFYGKQPGEKIFSLARPSNLLYIHGLGKGIYAAVIMDSTVTS